MPTDTTQSLPKAADAASETQTLVAVSSAHLVSHFYIMVLPVLLPLLKDRFEVGFLELGLALTAFNVVTGLTQAPMGVLVDRVGARPVLIAGLALGGLAFLSLGFANSYSWLLGAAIVAGLANCVYHPADYALLADGISEGRAGRAFSVHTFAGFVGGAIAPATLLALATYGGIQSALIFSGLVGPATALGLLLMPSPRSQAGRASLTGHATARSLGAGRGLTGVLTPSVLAMTGFFTLLALSNSAINTFSVVALIASHGVSFTDANIALTAYLAGSAIGVLLGGWLADRTSRHGNVTALGFGLAAAIMAPVATLTLPVALLVAAMGVSGIIFGSIQPARDMLVRKAAPPGAAGRVFGIVSTGFNIGGVVGPPMFGWLMDHGSPRGVLIAAVMFLAMTAVFGLLEERRTKGA